MTPRRPASSSSSGCPCGSGLLYADCCARWHAGPDALCAPDAESLMRSRYSAYVLRHQDYLLATWHPSTRPADLGPDPDGLQWLGLEVRASHIDDAEHARVEFVARNRLGGRAHRLHEISRFVREGGRWYYLDAAG